LIGIKKHNLMYKHLLGLFFLILLGAGCSDSKLEIGNINNRQQLDSIMALLPADSIVIDSLPHRTLHIKIKGNLSLHGIPVREANFSLKKEELEEMEVRYATKGCLSLLNMEESLHGLGKYESGTFTWNTDLKEISLMATDKWRYQTPEPLLLSDTLGFNYTVSYAGNVKNKITELYKEVPKNDKFYIYSVGVSFYTSIDYRLYLNGFQLGSSGDNVNHMLPLSGKQVLTVEFLPPFDRIREVNTYIKSLTAGGEQVIYVYKKNETGGSRIPVQKIVVDTDVDKKGAVQSYVFDIPDLPYSLDYVNGQDLRKVDDVKTLIYSYYTSFKEAIENRNTEKIIEMLYPMERFEALAFNSNASSLQYGWKYIDMMIDDNEGVDLMDINDLSVEYAGDGRLARLVPKRWKEDDSLVAAQVYLAGDSSRDIAYYVYLDKNNKLNFALR